MKLVYGTGNHKLMGEMTEAGYECLDMAFASGFRTFDTAYSYGNAEKNFGLWLQKRGVRDQITILDKGCNPGQIGCNDIFSGDTIRTQMKESLERMQVEYTDLYILHRDDETKPVDEIVEALNECKDRGWVKAFGGSNWKPHRIWQANEYAQKHGLTGFTAISPNYCLADYVNDPWGGSVTISGKENQSFREWLMENHMPVYTYSSLGRGFLSGKFRTDSELPIQECLPEAPIQEYYSQENIDRLARAEKLAQDKNVTVSQICLAWLLNQKMNIFPIVGPTSEKHMQDNVGALDVKLTEDEIMWLHGE